ncbi:MAG: hypothetical protein L0170_19135, partial [Acidobacteria bacterium]|nr:hypothetical protein [Acidobacteriota bacterium]
MRRGLKILLLVALLGASIGAPREMRGISASLRLSAAQEKREKGHGVREARATPRLVVDVAGADYLEVIDL